MYKLSLYEEYLELTGLGDLKLSINYNHIIDICYGVHKDVNIKDKSVIGRSIAGGLLIGNIGAIVGGLSGLIVNYEKNSTQFELIWCTVFC